VSCLALFQTVPHRSVIPYVPFRLPPPLCPVPPPAAVAVSVDVTGGVAVDVTGGVAVDVTGGVAVDVTGGVAVDVTGGVCVALPVVGDALWVPVVGDFDEVGFPVVPTLLPGATPPPWLMVGAELVCVAALWVGAPVELWVGNVVVGPVLVDGPLLEISTAMIATTPMAAAPMPANKKVLLTGLRGPGNRSASFW
jgi:hypothetical protein